MSNEPCTTATEIERKFEALEAASRDQADRMAVVREAITAAKEIRNRLELPVAKLLMEVRDHKYRIAWQHPSFEAFVEADCNFSLRKAQDLIRIYRKLVIELEVSEDKLRNLGWSKVAMFAGKLNKTNLETMLRDIASKSFADLRKSLKAERKPTQKKTAASPEAEGTLIVTPILAEALRRASTFSRTADTQTNMEFIARSFLQVPVPDAFARFTKIHPN